MPALNSYWIKIHVAAAITASGVFMVSGVVTRAVPAEVAVRARAREPRAGRGALSPDSTACRSAAMLAGCRRGSLDRLAVPASIAFAFPVWTFAIIAGAIWAEQAWGRYWGWDPKETWSFITWVAYAGYLHARATAGWRGRRAACCH